MLEIKTVNYDNPKQARVLKVCLSEWFRNPKDLNLTSPKMAYPFNFNHWVKNYYSSAPVETLALFADNWIVGHIALRYFELTKRAHIFHLIVAPDQRGKGYARQLIEAAEIAAGKAGYEQVTLYVNPGNRPAFNLYSRLGYQIEEERDDKHLRMGKTLLAG